jgi:hypothetical protein
MPRGRARSHPTVERTIHFYRADAGQDDAGRPIQFDFAPLLQHIHAMPFSDTDKGRYLTESGDDLACCWVDHVGFPHQLRFATIRRSALPQLEERGRLSLLEIPATSGIAEQVHIVVFRKMIVGAEFNFYGPRPSRLGDYLMAKGGKLCPGLSLEPLLRRDVTAQLNRLTNLRLMRLKIRSSYATTIQQIDQGLGGAFAGAARAGEADEVELILKREGRSRQSLASNLLETVKRLAGRRDIRSEALGFQVKGVDRETGRVCVIDVLSDVLISKRQILRQGERTRALDRADAYRAIEDAYTELKGELVEAAGVQE